MQISLAIKRTHEQFWISLSEETQGNTAAVPCTDYPEAISATFERVHPRSSQHRSSHPPAAHVGHRDAERAVEQLEARDEEVLAPDLLPERCAGVRGEGP